MTSITRIIKDPPPMGRLWTIDDIAAFAVGVDASELVKMSGFPIGMKLRGIRGLRWWPAAVAGYFERLSEGTIVADCVDSDEGARSLVPVIPRMEIDGLKDVA